MVVIRAHADEFKARADTGVTNSPASHTIRFLSAIGTSDENVLIVTPALQYEYVKSAQWTYQARLTANYANGNLGTASGLGDILASAIYTTKTTTAWQSRVSFGVKIPLALSTLKANGRPLPMQYQSSLGTTDLIAGYTLGNNQLSFSVGFQQPIIQANQNTFLTTQDSRPEAKKYWSSQNLIRKPDALLRAAYIAPLAPKWLASASVLAIYHIGNDTYINENAERVALAGSQGLTLNGTAQLFYRASQKVQFSILAGRPFIVREIRPDGLTRNFILIPEISILL